MPSASTSDFLHLSQMNYIFKGTSWTPATTLYVALYTVPPSLAGTGGTEVSVTGTGYSRIGISCDPINGRWGGPSSDPSAKAYSNLDDITFATPTGTWGTILAAALLDSQSAGGNSHLYYVATLASPKSVANGDGAPKILAGQLIISRAVC